MDEQAAELVYRQQHEHCTRVVQDAEEEKNRVVQDGQRARQEMEHTRKSCSEFTSQLARVPSRRTIP